MHFLITGGAGFLGINLCRHLLRRGHRVRVLDLVDFDYPENDRVEAFRGDVRDAGTVDRVVRDIDVVVHAAAALPLSSRAEILSTDAEGTAVVLERAFAAGVPRLVFTSSTAVYGVPDHHPLSETDELHGVGPYGEAKILAERYCERHRALGRCVTVLRPKSFVGPERLGAFELLYRWAADGRNFPVLGDGGNLYQLLDVEDLCAVILSCATLDTARVNRTFNVGAAVFGSMRENFQAVLDRAGHGGRVVGLPAAPAVMLLRLLEALHLSPIYRWIYDTAAQDSVVSIERLRESLGFVPQYSNFDWYLQHRGEYRGRTGISHRVPWKQGALGLAELFF